MTVATVTETFNFPWIELVKNSYSMRMRVTNFDDIGKRCFTRLVSEAVGGEKAFFLWENNTPLPLSSLPNSGIDLTLVENVGMDGRCYDHDLNEVDTRLRCIKLTPPPVSDNAILLASRAWRIETLITDNIEHLIMPEPVVTGTSPDVRIKTDPNKSITDWARFDANDDHETIVRPEVKRLTQWNIEQLSTMLQLTLRSFQMETALPPQDAQILDVLGIATQSLVSNRESFVSRSYIIKQALQSVFRSVGVELEFEIAFPQTAQDIASIGDAYGKGLNKDILNEYQVV